MSVTQYWASRRKIGLFHKKPYSLGTWSEISKLHGKENASHERIESSYWCGSKAKEFISESKEERWRILARRVGNALVVRSSVVNCIAVVKRLQSYIFDRFLLCLDSYKTDATLRRRLKKWQDATVIVKAQRGGDYHGSRPDYRFLVGVKSVVAARHERAYGETMVFTIREKLLNTGESKESYGETERRSKWRIIKKTIIPQKFWPSLGHTCRLIVSFTSHFPRKLLVLSWVSLSQVVIGLAITESTKNTSGHYEGCRRRSY